MAELEPKDVNERLRRHLVRIICNTNGITLLDTLDLAINSEIISNDSAVRSSMAEFRRLLFKFEADEIGIQALLEHPLTHALGHFLRNFPLKYREEHIHLTGSLTGDFIFPRLEKLLAGPSRDLYLSKLQVIYPNDSLEMKSAKDVDRLLSLRENERFLRYLAILLPAKLVLTTREAHKAAAFHMANELYYKYNVGFIRLKFTLSRATQNETEQIPGIESLTGEDVVLGLYEGFKSFQAKHPGFSFTLAPSFRKEPEFWDATRFRSKEEDFMAQVDFLLDLLKRYPELIGHLNDVDTVGNETGLFRKQDFFVMQPGFRKLHQHGFTLRSHHGETWKILRLGIQAVDNAMNIWHIDTLEHGLSLGINPNYYFHSIMERVMARNLAGIPLASNSMEAAELADMDWNDGGDILSKILSGTRLNAAEETELSRTKSEAAREIEHYQHDVLNRMIHKGVGITSLPSSNQRLTNAVADYKDHPFSWWEKKSLRQYVGTDNYVTLGTNFIKEMLILLLSDADNLKITKLLMVTTGETRRPYMGKLLWDMRNF